MIMDENELERILNNITKLETFVETYEKNKQALEMYVCDKNIELDNHATEIDKLMSKNKQLIADIETLKKQYSSGFPLLAEAYAEYFQLLDKRTESYLVNKSRPALVASKTVKEANRLKREAIVEAKKNQYIIAYYETYFPFLLEIKGELLDELAASEILQEYTQEERSDRVTWYVSKEEYRTYSTVKKNQLALDRYWERRLSNKGIGNLYERYVGFLYEMDGYEVEYKGILSGLEDLGRDLIASKNNEIIVVQCKYWSEFKMIHENHIFQFFGTTYKYKTDNPRKKVNACFYTKTVLSELARKFAEDFDIKLVENFRLKRYPCIKCNIGRQTGEKIYHLPFDQQYDHTKIEKSRGEFYTMTVDEAESQGFRRAWRWHSDKDRK